MLIVMNPICSSESATGRQAVQTPYRPHGFQVSEYATYQASEPVWVHSIRRSIWLCGLHGIEVFVAFREKRSYAWRVF
jgi:hypothetical protein